MKHLFLLLLFLVAAASARRKHRKSHLQSHHPTPFHTTGKRSTDNANLYEDYTNTGSYRRQEVIHAINEKDVANDDDIESYGKTIDSSDNAVGESGKSSIPSATNTKDIISKIKEIQDKIFKRTNGGELAAKLNEMGPSPDPQTSIDLKHVDNTTMEMSKLKSEMRKLDAIVKNLNKNTTSTKSSKSFVKDNNTKLSDVSRDNNGGKTERRKVIPEEVVDKILEKFQQLRSEAKHMAMLESKHDIENNSPVTGTRQSESSNNSPYASIGAAKQNSEVKNRTSSSNDVKAIGFQSDNSVQIPIDDTGSRVKDETSMHQSGNVPLMFIKSGEALVPVYDSQPKMSLTGTAMAQLNSPATVGLPSLPNNIVPISSPSAQDNNPYIPAPNNAAPATSRCQIPGVGCPTPTLAQLISQARQLQHQINDVQQRVMQAPLQPPMQAQLQPSIQSQLQPSMQSQMQIPESDNKNQLETDIENRAHQDSTLTFFGGNQDADPRLSAPSMQTEPSTAALINNILQNPGFPQLAAQMMNLNVPLQNPNLAQSLQSKMPQTELASARSQGRGNNAQMMQPSDVNFHLQQNLANSNNPGDTSMLQGVGQQPQPRQQQFMDPSYPTNPSLSLNANPFTESRMEQPHDNNQQFMPKSMPVNDISDPLPDPSEEPELQFQHESPDQLLDYAKVKSMQRSFRPDNRATASIDPYHVDRNRMSFTDGNQRSALKPFNNIDPSTLLDKIHGTELNGGLLGAGDPSWFSPTYKQEKERTNEFGGSPDDLLETLRKQNDKLFESDGHNLENQFRKSLPRVSNGRSRGSILADIDPSFADDIQTNGQQFDVKSKMEALPGDRMSSQQRYRPSASFQPTDFSVLSGDMVQYKHGRMSMDSSNVVNSYLRDSQAQYRNKIARPSNKTETGVVRASITKSLPEDNIELQVNGLILSQGPETRSRIENGRIINGKGKTFSSKGPIQIQLSHGANKRKIVNIITNTRFNVTETKKRAHISRRPVKIKKRD